MVADALRLYCPQHIIFPCLLSLSLLVLCIFAAILIEDSFILFLSLVVHSHVTFLSPISSLLPCYGNPNLFFKVVRYFFYLTVFSTNMMFWIIWDHFYAYYSSFYNIVLKLTKSMQVTKKFKYDGVHGKVALCAHLIL